MIQLSESSEDERQFLVPGYTERSSRFGTRSSTPGTSSSVVSSVVFGPISEKVLCIWSQLPEAIRLDPSLTAIEREYAWISHNPVTTGSFNPMDGETLVVNMSVSTENFATGNEKKKPNNNVHGYSQIGKPCYRYTKLVLLVCCWITFTVG